jgi:hypothetical protein
VGTFTWTATAIDTAGNKTTQTGTYKVCTSSTGSAADQRHRAPDRADHQRVQGGQHHPGEVPAEERRGTVVQAATAPVWLTPVLGAKMSMPVDETAVTVSADSGSTFRYDATAQQYIYNWKTPSTGGNYYQIGVRLDDGQVYYVNIGLR